MLIFVAMKKAVSLFLVFLYSTFSIGATMRLHYCGGEIAEVNYSFTNPNKKIKCCGEEETEEEDSECCKNSTLNLKIKDNHAAAKLNLLKVCSVNLLPFYNNATSASLYRFNTLNSNGLFKIPPLISYNRPVYLLNSVFRI